MLLTLWPFDSQMLYLWHKTPRRALQNSVWGKEAWKSFSTDRHEVVYLKEKQPEAYLRNHGLRTDAYHTAKRSWGHCWHSSEIIGIWWLVIKIYGEGMNKANMELLFTKSSKLDAGCIEWNN